MEKKSVRITKKAVLYLFVLILLVCFVFPFFWMLRTSLMEINQIFQLPPLVFFKIHRIAKLNLFRTFHRIDFFSHGSHSSFYNIDRMMTG